MYDSPNCLCCSPFCCFFLLRPLTSHIAGCQADCNRRMCKQSSTNRSGPEFLSATKDGTPSEVFWILQTKKYSIYGQCRSGLETAIDNGSGFDHSHPTNSQHWERRRFLPFWTPVPCFFHHCSSAAVCSHLYPHWLWALPGSNSAAASRFETFALVCFTMRTSGTYPEDCSAWSMVFCLFTLSCKSQYAGRTFFPRW